MKLALYGGSFDPPHAGHVEVVTKALELLPIDKLIIVPAWRNPFKRSVIADGATRYGWLKTIFATFEKVEISDFELSQNRSVFTIETVEHFAPMVEEIYLIIGADNLESLNQWHRYEELERRVTWVVASRDGIAIPKTMIHLAVDVPICSSDIRRTLTSLGLESEIETKILTYYKENL
ncbi:nicotinate (nicotinamide) nucleotide adenylyltransferase [Sulfuricurvum sp.]|uniref:nicotinate (nicotinamide) nucleotide adenylyltransferase n=1 Tax=Sulfuricurvum sp. TaxID=2025608 RepID=UPI002E31D6FC|nr:nicotinate (nicotinamide) nucleotide adenylyltransferase [Sulfuricurvum sp.]HEX5329980.1 nicotinate (nicotinamide) nucleotide adenylyltransferase [Sulfuricurvum sp.]